MSQAISKQEAAARTAACFTMECLVLGILDVIIRADNSNSTSNEISAFAPFEAGLVILWVYVLSHRGYYSRYLSAARAGTCLATSSCAVMIFMIYWAFHPTPEFGLVEFIVFIFWPANIGIMVGLVAPLGSIEGKDSGDTLAHETTETV